MKSLITISYISACISLILALIRLMYWIMEMSVLTLLDLSAAFDTMDHILLSRLETSFEFLDLYMRGLSLT